MLDPSRGSLTSPTRGSESWYCPSPDPNTSCHAGADTPGRVGRVGVLPVQGPASTFLPITSSSGRAGQDWVDFGLAEPHTVLFHEPGSSSVWVGGRGKVYFFDFPEGKNASMRTVSLDPSAWTPLLAPGTELSPFLLPSPPHFSHLPSVLGEGPQGIRGS